MGYFIFTDNSTGKSAISRIELPPFLKMTAQKKQKGEDIHRGQLLRMANFTVVSKEKCRDKYTHILNYRPWYSIKGIDDIVLILDSHLCVMRNSNANSCPGGILLFKI
jgi:hypothetical protein